METLRGVPVGTDLARSDADRAALQLFFARVALGRPLVAPPDVAPERVAALRTAFDATMQDAAFLDDARLQHADIDPVGGEAINALLDRVYAAPPEVAARIRELVK